MQRRPRQRVVQEDEAVNHPGRLAIASGLRLDAVGRVELDGPLLAAGRAPDGQRQRAAGAVGMLPEQLHLRERAEPRGGRVAAYRAVDALQQLIRNPLPVRYGIEGGEAGQTASGERLVLQFVGQVKRQRAVAARPLGIAHPQGRRGHAKQRLDRLPRPLRAHEEVARLAEAAVGSGEVEFGVVHFADPQAEQPPVVGLVDPQQLLLDLEKEPQGPRLVAPAQAAAPLVVAGPASVADLVGAVAVVVPGGVEQRVGLRIAACTRAGLRREQGVPGLEGPAAEPLRRELPQQLQRAVGPFGEKRLRLREKRRRAGVVRAAAKRGGEEQQGSADESFHGVRDWVLVKSGGRLPRSELREEVELVEQRGDDT